MRNCGSQSKRAYPDGNLSEAGKSYSSFPNRFLSAGIGGGPGCGEHWSEAKMCPLLPHQTLAQKPRKKWRHSRRCAMFYWLPCFVLTSRNTQAAQDRDHSIGISVILCSLLISPIPLLAR